MLMGEGVLVSRIVLEDLALVGLSKNLRRLGSPSPRQNLREWFHSVKFRGENSQMEMLFLTLEVPKRCWQMRHDWCLTKNLKQTWSTYTLRSKYYTMKISQYETSGIGVRLIKVFHNIFMWSKLGLVKRFPSVQSLRKWEQCLALSPACGLSTKKSKFQIEDDQNHTSVTIGYIRLVSFDSSFLQILVLAETWNARPSPHE